MDLLPILSRYIKFINPETILLDLDLYLFISLDLHGAFHNWPKKYIKYLKMWSLRRVLRSS